MSIGQYPQFLRYWIGDTASLWWGNTFQVALYWGHGDPCPRCPGTGVVELLVHDSRVRGWPYRGSVVSPFRGSPSDGHGFLLARGGVWRPGSLARMAWRRPWGVIDAASAAWGLTFIANASGGPSLWPRLIPETGLSLAMKLEQTGWNVSAVGGSITGGLLAMVVPLSALALIAGAIFLVAGLNLAALSLPPRRVPNSSKSESMPPYGHGLLYGPMSAYGHRCSCFG